MRRLLAIAISVCTLAVCDGAWAEDRAIELHTKMVAPSTATAEREIAHYDLAVTLFGRGLVQLSAFMKLVPREMPAASPAAQ